MAARRTTTRRTASIIANRMQRDPNQIQGNILNPFAREHSAFLFLRFDEDAAAARRSLREAISPRVTSAARQADLAATWQRTPDEERPRHGQTVGMFGLS